MLLSLQKKQSLYYKPLCSVLNGYTKNNKKNTCCEFCKMKVNLVKSSFYTVCDITCFRAVGICAKVTKDSNNIGDFLTLYNPPSNNQINISGKQTLSTHVIESKEKKDNLSLTSLSVSLKCVIPLEPQRSIGTSRMPLPAS